MTINYNRKMLNIDENGGQHDSSNNVGGHEKRTVSIGGVKNGV